MFSHIPGIGDKVEPFALLELLYSTPEIPVSTFNGCDGLDLEAELRRRWCLREDESAAKEEVDVAEEGGDMERKVCEGHCSQINCPDPLCVSLRCVQGDNAISVPFAGCPILAKCCSRTAQGVMCPFLFARCRGYSGAICSGVPPVLQLDATLLRRLLSLYYREGIQGSRGFAGGLEV